MARNRMERREKKREGGGGERDLGVLTAREDGTTGNAVKFQNKLDSAPHPCDHRVPRSFPCSRNSTSTFTHAALTHAPATLTHELV